MQPIRTTGQVCSLQRRCLTERTAGNLRATGIIRYETYSCSCCTQQEAILLHLFAKQKNMTGATTAIERRGTTQVLLDVLLVGVHLWSP